MGPYVGVVQRCGQQTPTSGACIPRNSDSEMCGAIRPRPAARGNIPIEVDPFLVYYNIPEKGNIAEAVMRLQLHHDGGPSGIRDKHLRMWLCAATGEEDPDPGNWEKVIAIIQVAFRG